MTNAPRKLTTVVQMLHAETLVVDSLALVRVDSLVMGTLVMVLLLFLFNFYCFLNTYYADIDECETENKCGANSACTNTIGGYSCSCLSGFYSTLLGCIGKIFYKKGLLFFLLFTMLTIFLDKNECIVGPNNCTGNTTCVNNIGGYTCECRGTLDASGNCQGKICYFRK